MIPIPIGNRDNEQFSAPNACGNFVNLSLLYQSSFGVRSDAHVNCWGRGWLNEKRRYDARHLSTCALAVGAIDGRTSISELMMPITNNASDRGICTDNAYIVPVLSGEPIGLEQLSYIDNVIELVWACYAFVTVF